MWCTLCPLYALMIFIQLGSKTESQCFTLRLVDWYSIKLLPPDNKDTQKNKYTLHFHQFEDRLPFWKALLSPENKDALKQVHITFSSVWGYTVCFICILFKCMHKKTVKSSCILYLDNFVYLYMYVLHFCVTFCLICMYHIMCECIYVWIVLNVCNCTHERTNKISCILYLGRLPLWKAILGLIPPTIHPQDITPCLLPPRTFTP